MRHPLLTQPVAHRALDAAVTGIVIVDATAPGQPLTYVNAGFERITGYPAADVLGSNCRILQGPGTDPAALAEMRTALARGEACRVTLLNYRADGSSFWNELTLSPVTDDSGGVIQYIGIQDDVTERQEARARVEHLAFHDGLTGLANRHALQQALESATTRARDEGDSVALLYLDLDGFKRINDTLGHRAGDDLLEMVARRLETVVRPVDVLARQGGDEFLILLDRLGRDDEAIAAAVARRVVETMRKPFKVMGAHVQVEVSVGASLFPRDAGDEETLLQHADTAMYQAKERGGTRWALYGAPVQSTRPLTVPLAWTPESTPAGTAVDLETLITGEGLRSVYQPLVELETGDVVGYEALVRGPVGTPFERPDQLFAAARAADRMAELDWACRAAAARGALAAGFPAPLRLFINVEPDALGMPCPPRFEEVWARAEALDIVVEVTERALADRPADLLRAIESCRERGWSIALDDVGADSRSLALLSLLRPDVVKLDLRLIQERPDRDIASVVAAVNAYAERTGAVVLAEGIETDQHLETARAVGATYGQGWQFGQPEPLPEALNSGMRAMRSVPRAPSPSGATPFEVVGQSLALRRATKPLLLAMSWQLEREAMALGETAILLSAFQDARHFTPDTRRRYAALAAKLGFVVSLGVGLEAEPAAGVRGATLVDDDALRDEWSVVVLSPHFAGALVAIDLGDRGPESDRRFDFAVTYDRDLVMSAAGSLMRRVHPIT